MSYNILTGDLIITDNYCQDCWNMWGQYQGLTNLTNNSFTLTVAGEGGAVYTTPYIDYESITVTLTVTLLSGDAYIYKNSDSSTSMSVGVEKKFLLDSDDKVYIFASTTQQSTFSYTITLNENVLSDTSNYMTGNLSSSNGVYTISSDTLEVENISAITTNTYSELEFDIIATTSNATFQIFKYGANSTVGSYSISTSSSTHFKLCFDGYDTVTVYKDGTQVLSTSDNTSIHLVFNGTLQLSNATWITGSFSKISGWVTWLKNWFYNKDETEELLSEDTGWTSCTYSSGYTDYSSAYSGLKVRRIGKFVELRGYWTPSSNKSSSSTEVQFATLPNSKFYPSQYQVGVMQGSGVNKWTLVVRTDGKMYWRGYGTNEYVDMPSGAWCCTHMTWMVE